MCFKAIRNGINLKLESIQILSNGNSGWESDLLVFGKHITQLFGPNGCGKTPIVQSIAFCLGYPCIFRNDIYDKCNHAVLKINTKKGALKIKRVFSKDVDIEVTESDNNKQRFFNEKDFSIFMFEWLDLPIGNLVTNSNKITSPYLASMLPIFYLDQDEGYSRIYCPPNSFIKDQFTEMLRIIFRLPIKNSFDKKKERIEAKNKLDFLDKQVESYANQYNIAKNNTLEIRKTSIQLKEEIDSLEEEINNLKSSGANQNDSINAYDFMINEHRKSISELTLQIDELNQRSNSVKRIVHEINTEIDTLNLNEEARRVFMSFSEICGANHCKLFSYSSDSYSKNLLYLKDQIKDLERNSKIALTKIDELKKYKSEYESKIKLIVDERNAIQEKSEISALIAVISGLKNQIFALQNQRNDIAKKESLQEKHLSELLKRDNALKKYESYSANRASIPELIKLRADLRQYFLNWLDQLSTKNINHDISFKDDFVPVLGVETVTQLKGSTRIRAVLAYHAALFELMTNYDNYNPFGFLILDTPKQHEIHNDDLDKYLKGLKELCTTHDVQVIFSTTEYHYQGDYNDIQWTPKYDGAEQKMFLKVVS